jgi:hypothetical protein
MLTWKDVKTSRVNLFLLNAAPFIRVWSTDICTAYSIDILSNGLTQCATPCRLDEHIGIAHQIGRHPKLVSLLNLTCELSQWCGIDCACAVTVISFDTRHPRVYQLTPSLSLTNSAHDKNAIRIDNKYGEKVGYIRATVAESLAYIMDTQGHIRIDGSIPRDREGDYYTWAQPRK